jgi:hypothetical protein
MSFGSYYDFKTINFQGSIFGWSILSLASAHKAASLIQNVQDGGLRQKSM